MARMGVLAAILLISFVSTLSDASAGLRLRDLLADGPVKDKKPDSQKVGMRNVNFALFWNFD